MNISRDEFIKTLIKKTEQLENTDVSEFFADLNWEKEQLFGNIYDITFSKKLCEVKENILNWLLIAFIWSEKDELMNKRISTQIQDIVPETEMLFQNIRNLLKQPDVQNPKIDFEENYMNRKYMKSIKDSQISLFDLFATEDWKKEIAQKQIIYLLKNKVSEEEFLFIEKILKKMRILSYDIEWNQIIVDVTNYLEGFILWNIRYHIKPLELKNNPNKNTLSEIRNLNDFISLELDFKNDQLEVIDINHDTKEILIKQNYQFNGVKYGNIESKYKQIEHKQYPDDKFKIKDISTDLIWFVKKYFESFLIKSNLSSLMTYCYIKDISFKTRNIIFGLTNKDLYEKTEQQFIKNKIWLFFPGFQFCYYIDNVSDKTKTEERDENKKNKTKLMDINSPISIKTDETKTLDNFYALDKNQIQWIVDIIKNGGNIAINGSTGSGKTHLTHALKNILKSELNTVYTTWEKFCNVFRGLARNYKWENNKPNNNRNSFTDSFEWIDVLIIDWIEHLWWETRGSTQNILKKILNKNPDMRLIITSKTGINNIPRTKKHKSMDGAVWYEASNILQEIKNLNLVMLQPPEEQKSKKIIENQWIAFLNKKNDLFLPRELPVGVINFLARKINPSLYEQIFESIKLNLSNNFSCEAIFMIIQNLVSEKIRPEPEEIIDIVIDSFLEWKIWKYMNLNTDVILFDKKDIMNMLNWPVKTGSFESIVLCLCVFFIKQSYNNKNYTEIWKYFNGRRDCGKLYSDAFKMIVNCKSINKIIEKDIEKFLFKTYWVGGVGGEQISIF